MNVLSLFDGISSGQIALQRAGVKYKSYFASETDKYACQVTSYRHPNTIFIGDARNIEPEKLPSIDLLIGGSPCQSFSNAGNHKNFNDERGLLFFEYVRMLKECKPKHFLFENVRMRKDWIQIISKHLDIEPVMIDSALFSAQQRRRLYWTNIKIKKFPNQNILLNDILESGWSEREKSYTIDAHYANAGANAGGLNDYLNRHHRQLIIDNGKFRKLTPVECERLQTLPDNYTLVPHPVYKNKMMSNTRRYKLIGNAWTVDVVAHIFLGLNH